MRPTTIVLHFLIHNPFCIHKHMQIYDWQGKFIKKLKVSSENSVSRLIKCNINYCNQIYRSNHWELHCRIDKKKSNWYEKNSLKKIKEYISSWLPKMGPYSFIKLFKLIFKGFFLKLYFVLKTYVNSNCWHYSYN